jgi:hypothetical protein
VSRGWSGHHDLVGKKERDRDERPEGEPTVLSAQEAMSLISPDPGADLPSDLGGAPGSGSEPDATPLEDPGEGEQPGSL